MDRVIPVINCPHGDTSCAAGKADKLRAFSNYVHLDIADGTFTPSPQGIDPEAWKRIGEGLQLEVHLMVTEPEKILDSWLAAGAKRVIVHIEVFEGAEGEQRFADIEARCDTARAQVVCAARSDTSSEELARYASHTNEFCILAVNPGPAGQELQPKALDLIRALHTAVPQANIEVDGGITPETARAVGEAGATTVCAGTYIFANQWPEAAFAELQNALQ